MNFVQGEQKRGRKHNYGRSIRAFISVYRKLFIFVCFIYEGEDPNLVQLRVDCQLPIPRVEHRSGILYLHSHKHEQFSDLDQDRRNIIRT